MSLGNMEGSLWKVVMAIAVKEHGPYEPEQKKINIDNHC